MDIGATTSSNMTLGGQSFCASVFPAVLYSSMMGWNGSHVLRFKNHEKGKILTLGKTEFWAMGSPRIVCVFVHVGVWCSYPMSQPLSWGYLHLQLIFIYMEPFRSVFTEAANTSGSWLSVSSASSAPSQKIQFQASQVGLSRVVFNLQ